MCKRASLHELTYIKARGQARVGQLRLPSLDPPHCDRAVRGGHLGSAQDGAHGPHAHVAPCLAS